MQGTLSTVRAMPVGELVTTKDMVTFKVKLTAELERPRLSLTWILKVYEFEVVALPESTPLLDRENPVGSVPDVWDQVYGGVPPAAAKVWEYWVLTEASGRLAVVMAGVAE